MKKTEQSILSIFKELHRKGKTIVIVTHDHQVAEVCDRIIYIKEGIVV